MDSDTDLLWNTLWYPSPPWNELEIERMKLPMLLSKDLVDWWWQAVRPAQLKFARVIGSDDCYLLRIEWGDKHLDYRLGPSLTDRELKVDIPETLRGMAGFLGVPLGEPEPTQYISMAYIGYKYSRGPSQMSPIPWDDWK